MNLTKEQILGFFQKTQALLEGHFLLTSGRHSNQYFQCAKVLQNPEYAEKICAELSQYFAEDKIDKVIAPAMGGIIVGWEVARLMKKQFIFAEREKEKFEVRRGFEIIPGERYLVCEDVVTTGGSVQEVIDLVKANGAEVAGAAYLVDRSNGKVDFGVKQKAAVTLQVISYSSEECPLCKQNVPIVKPGSRKIF